jgi:uncharacterized membrane protein
MSDWYYAVNNEQKGPVNESELKAQLAANKIPSDSLVWKEGMDNWTPANQVSAFTFREPPVPARGGTLTPSPASVAHVPGADNPESAVPVTMASLLGSGEALEVDAEDAEKNKVMGILCYLIALWWLPLVVASHSPFAKYHANQGFCLFVFTLVVLVTKWIIVGLLSMLGLDRLDWIFGLLLIPVLILLILGVINAAAGKCVPLPYIGKFKVIK